MYVIIVHLNIISITIIYYFRTAFPNEVSPIGLHSAMFIPTLRGQGTKEQIEKWVPLAENHQIIGTYVQTELGHGMYRYVVSTELYCSISIMDYFTSCQYCL